MNLALISEMALREDLSRAFIWIILITEEQINPGDYKKINYSKWGAKDCDCTHGRL